MCKYTSLFFTLLLSVSNLFPQIDFTCPSDSILDERLRNEPEFRNIFIHGFQQNRDYSEIEPKVIPVVFHIFHNNEEYGEGYHFTEEYVLSKLDTANMCLDGLYQSSESSLPWDTLNSKLDLCLVNEIDELGNSIGIQYHDLSLTDFNFDESPFYNQTNHSIIQESIVENCININIGPWFGHGGIYTYDIDIVIKSFNFIYYNKTLIHELGHGLGIAHTFHGYGLDCESALNESDCVTQGDFVCDTSPTIMSDCSNYVCDGQLESLNTNWMSYCPHGNSFTEGQIERMHWFIDEFNPHGILNGLSMCHYYPCVWDLNGDGMVSLQDLIQFLSVINTEVEVYEGDFNINGTADTNDLLELLSYFSFNCVTEEMGN